MFISLLYHIIDSNITSKISISPSVFREQLSYLRDEGFVSLTTSQITSWLDDGIALPQRAVLLTFDDGYVDNVTQALPILHEFDMKAIIFMVSGFVGQTNHWNPRACYNTQHLSWKD